MTETTAAAARPPELVSVERALWSGEATAIFARTLDGELGILPGHIPLLGALAPASLGVLGRERENRVLTAWNLAGAGS